MNIKIEIVKKKDTDIREVFAKTEETAHRYMLGLANVSKEVMHNVINTKTKFSTGRLANSIEVEDNFQIDKTIGVGDRDKLPIYWYVLNYGRWYDTGEPYIPGRPTFDRSSPRRIHGIAGTPFEYIKGHPDYIVPMRPIMGIGYIEMAISVASNYFNTQKPK